MDTGEPLSLDTNRALSGGKGFINHVFNFNNDTKVELLNLGQYLIMVLIPFPLGIILMKYACVLWSPFMDLGMES